MSDTFDNNPRAVVGGNQPPIAALISGEENFAQTVTDWLNDEFKAVPLTVEALLEEARALPPEIDDDDTKGRYASVIKRIRDEAKRLSAFQEKEKAPYLRGGQAVDQFFFGLIDRLARRDKKNKAGAADVLLQRMTNYDTRKLHEELERRRVEAAEAARIAREAAAKAAREAAEAEQARLAAERARKPETVEAKHAVALQAEQAAASARVEADLAIGRAQETHIDTLAKPADLMRNRGADGTLSTMATEPFAEVTDPDALDKDKLWPFIPLAAKEQALQAWAKNTGHTQMMVGASIGKRPKSQVR